jgi:3-hydroxyacyl-CoA dehydrogenase
MTWRADELLVGVVGAGAMGQGIIQVAVSNGIKTIIHDSRPETAVEALAQVSGRLDSCPA